jgi:uncharacterized coiled-coil DUF342 family protein
MNQDLIEMREQIFREYRESVGHVKELDSRYANLVQQLSDLRDSREAAYAEMHRTREMIDIMITEDCDPVIAKLRYSERISENLKDCDVATNSSDYRMMEKMSNARR